MPPTKRPIPPIVLIIAGFVAFWVCLVLLFAAQTMLAVQQTWADAMRGSLILWVPWIAVSPMMLGAAFALPLGGVRLWKFILGHIAIAVMLIFMSGWVSRNVMPAPSHAAQDPLALPQPGQQGANGLPPPRQDPNGLPPLHVGPNGEILRPGDPGYGPYQPGNPGYGQPRPGDPGFVQPGPNGQPPVQGIALSPNAQRPFTATMLNFLRTLPVGLPLYLASLFLVGSINLHRLNLDKERRASELERQLTDARLETLRAQLHPHFLFNTLNALMSLVHSNPDKAEEMILCLSSLLRATLEAKDKPRIPLRDELQLAHEYLAIQSLRYGERLKTLEILPPETLACSVPPLILQLVLENAIKYAIDRHAAGGTITLRAERLGDKLIIEVEDSGSGRNTETRESHGIGVANVRARLAASFPGRDVSFDLIPNHLGGITARFQLPVTAEITADA